VTITRGTITFDAGPLVKLDRDDRREWARLHVLVCQQTLPVVPAPVVTQVWRSGRQANLSRALKHMRIEPVDDELARQAGELLAATGSRDAVDAIVVASAARRRDDVVTSDRMDIASLAAHVPGVNVVRA
jgi:hypothetical protein